MVYSEFIGSGLLWLTFLGQYPATLGNVMERDGMEGKYTVGGIRYRNLSRANVARLAIGMKRCSKCGETYPVDQFTADRNRSDGLYLHCKHCLAAYRESTRSARREYTESLPSTDHPKKRSDPARVIFGNTQFRLNICSGLLVFLYIQSEYEYMG